MICITFAICVVPGDMTQLQLQVSIHTCIVVCTAACYSQRHCIYCCIVHVILYFVSQWYWSAMLVLCMCQTYRDQVRCITAKLLMHVHCI